MPIGQVLEAIAGTLIRGNRDVYFSGVAIDSRVIQPADLFIPFAGEKVDGHQFILAALAKGASVALASKDWVVPDDFPADKALIVVEDVLWSFQQLAAFWVSHLGIKPIIGITGSNGKTSTKDLIAAVLAQRFPVLKTQGNHNNEIGVPITLLQGKKEHQAAVIEMGMRGLGEITELTDLVRPTIGVITNVGQSHLALLGSQEKIAEAKGELIAALPKTGMAILNGDDPLVRQMRTRAKCPVLFYGLESGEIRAEQINSRGEKGMTFDLVTPQGRIAIALPLLGLHNVYNALAAAAVGSILQLDLKAIKAGLEGSELTAMRLEVLKTRAGNQIINDAYNASPASMRSALGILADLASSGALFSIAVLGNMYELGSESESLHQLVGQQVAALGVDLLLTVGDLASAIAEGARAAGMMADNIVVCANNTMAIAALQARLQEKSIVLVKGSRGMKMEDIVTYLQEC